MAGKAKVALYGNPNRCAIVDLDATAGATIGRDLRLPDGTVPTLAELAAALSALLGAGGTTARNDVSITLWRLIREVPANVTAVAALASQGLVTRIAGNNWVAREIAIASESRLSLANGDGVAGNPTLDLAAEVIASLMLADTAVQPEELGAVAFSNNYADLDDAPPRYLVQEEAERFWTADEFGRGRNIIGVRNSGETFVYLPHDLPVEHIVTVKDEVGDGDKVIRIY